MSARLQRDPYVIPIDVLANEQAEAEILTVLLNSTSAVAAYADQLVDDDFYFPHTRAVFRAIADVVAAAKPVTRAFVLEELRQSDAIGQLKSKRGEIYLEELETNPVVEDIAEHFRLLRQKADRRRLVELDKDLRNAITAGEDPIGVAEVLGARLAQLGSGQPAQSPAAWTSAAALALVIGGAQRVQSGFDTFDTNTRGGPRIGKRIVIGGAPGAGKTTWLVQMLWDLARRGTLVLLLCFDEEAEDILIRVGQLNGLAREDLERGDETARRELSEVLNSTPSFMLLDGDQDEVTIESASAELARRRQPGQFSVLGVDSIQTARVIGDDTAESAKARVDMVMGALKRAGKVDKHLVLATCELNRGGYRSNNAAERVDDLAAFKESGGVEYGATMAMVLRSVKDAEGLIDVTVPKNRMGLRKPFRLQLDFQSASMREVSLPDTAETEAVTSPMQKAKDKLMAVIEKSIEPITSASELARRVKMSKATALKAVKELIEDGRLRKPEDGPFIPVPTGSRTGSEPAAVEHGSSGSRPYRAEPRTGTAPGTGDRGDP